MFVQCHTIIQDPVLSFKIRKYINQTPFLTTGEEDDENLKIVGQITSNTDLIVLEATLLSMESLRTLQLKFKDKHFIILTDLLLFSRVPKSNQTVVLSKNITYSDFLNALDLLAESKSECEMEHNKIQKIG